MLNPGFWFRDCYKSRNLEINGFGYYLQRNKIVPEPYEAIKMQLNVPKSYGRP